MSGQKPSHFVDPKGRKWTVQLNINAGITWGYCFHDAWKNMTLVSIRTIIHTRVSWHSQIAQQQLPYSSFFIKSYPCNVISCNNAITSNCIMAIKHFDGCVRLGNLTHVPVPFQLEWLPFFSQSQCLPGSPLHTSSYLDHFLYGTVCPGTPVWSAAEVQRCVKWVINLRE